MMTRSYTLAPAGTGPCWRVRADKGAHGPAIQAAIRLRGVTMRTSFDWHSAIQFGLVGWLLVAVACAPAAGPSGAAGRAADAPAAQRQSAPAAATAAPALSPALQA